MADRRAQLKEIGDSPAIHNLPSGGLSTNDQLQVNPEGAGRRRRYRRRVFKDMPHGGQPGGLMTPNPYYEVDQNNADKDAQEYDPYWQDPQNWQEYPMPTDKHWNQGYHLQTTYAIKHGIPISDALVVKAATEGTSVSDAAESTVSLPVSHIYKDLEEMANFMMDDIEALESAGEDVSEYKKHLEAFKGILPKNS